MSWPLLACLNRCIFNVTSLNLSMTKPQGKYSQVVSPEHRQKRKKGYNCFGRRGLVHLKVQPVIAFSQYERSFLHKLTSHELPTFPQQPHRRAQSLYQQTWLCRRWQWGWLFAESAQGSNKGQFQWSKSKQKSLAGWKALGCPGLGHKQLDKNWSRFAIWRDNVVQSSKVSLHEAIQHFSLATDGGFHVHIWLLLSSKNEWHQKAKSRRTRYQRNIYL